ncbi:hypothetical protein [Lysobacter sp. A421]
MQVKLFWVQAPMQDKGFIGAHNAGKAEDFEARINEWLSQNHAVEFQHIQQSACGGSMQPALWLISVWYNVAS